MNPEISYASQSENIGPEPTPQSFFNRLIGVYFSPGETFQEIGRAPRVLLPIIVFAALAMITSFIVIKRVPLEVSMKQVDEQLQRQVESGRITQEQAEQRREASKPIVNFFRMAIPVIAPVGVIVIALIITGVAKLVSLLIGVENSFKPLFSVALYATLAISIISSILSVILIFIKPAEDIDLENPLPSNVAGLLSALGMAMQSRFLKIFLGYLDVFFIWKLALLAIGFAAVSKKLKNSTALTWVVIIALLIMLIHSSYSAVFG
ncbi:MAG: YIP1 family protein [Blastocatellia bacterium]|nr:YIP1 family protein [Blastocatellia bacterium]